MTHQKQWAYLALSAWFLNTTLKRTRDFLLCVWGVGMTNFRTASRKELGENWISCVKKQDSDQRMIGEKWKRPKVSMKESLIAKFGTIWAWK